MSWIADFAGALFGGALAGAIVGVRLYRQGRQDAAAEKRDHDPDQ